MAFRRNSWLSAHKAMARNVSKIDYFCEACGSRVNPGSGSCPSCNRFFYGIRCPRCNTEGKPETFLNGCPSCGYLDNNSSLVLNTHEQHKSYWPARYYWLLSVGVVVVLLGIIYLWLGSL